MLRLSLPSAKPGMELAMPIFHPTLPGHVLLRPGFVMDPPALKRLTELKVGQIWIRYPALAEVMRFVNPEVSLEQANLTSMVGRTMEKLSDPKYAELDFKVFAEAVRSMLGKLAEANSSTLLVSDLVAAESPLAMHSGAVCFLSLLMGLKLGEYIVEQRPKVHPTSARNVQNLAVAAMLHDVGMLRITDEARERWTETGDESDPAYQRHVQLGYDLIRGKVEPTAAATVLHHHQAYDGSGFPKSRLEMGKRSGLAGEQIHVFARILSIADWYDTLRNPPIGCYAPERRVPAVRVLRTMLSMARRRLIDPIAFKGLLSVVPAYLPGTTVKLTTGQWAAVTDFDPLRPCRPVVRPFRKLPGSGGLDEDDLGPPLDLVEHQEIQVAIAEDQGVLADNFEAGDPTEFDLRVLRLPKPKRAQRAA